MYAPCTRKGYAVQRAAWTVVSTLGPRALPGPAAPWNPPLRAPEWERLVAAWDDLVGPHDAMAVYQRPQQARPGFAVLLLRAGRPVAFVRVRRGGAAAFAIEEQVLAALAAAGITSFWHPRPLGLATAGTWQSLATTALPPAPHRPPRRPDLPTITRAIQQALTATLPRPPDAGPQWEPMHGDLTPWNVRQVGSRVAVVDWEDAGWGPPQADITLYLATAAALGASVPAGGSAEAAAFWLSRVAARPGGEVDDELGDRLRVALERLATQR